MSRKKSTKQTAKPNAEQQPEPKWQTVEKIVAHLEKVLTPLARVEHNIFLPVLGRPERRPRQCDIVITYGQAPRQTITIVEVQDRRSRPNITTFHGWVTKMREVGAQHLICVSERGFPDSIISEAFTLGPTVRLMSLQEVENTNRQGLITADFLIYKEPKFTFESVGPDIRLKPVDSGLEPKPTKIDLEINSDDKVFSLEDSLERLSLDELIATVLDKDVRSLLDSQGIAQPDTYELEITIGGAEKVLYLHIGEQRYKLISLDLSLKVYMEVTLVPLTHLVYKQESIDGTLAWVELARGVIKGKEVQVQVVFKPDTRGFLVLSAITTQGIQDLYFDVYSDKASWQSVIDHYNSYEHTIKLS